MAIGWSSTIFTKIPNDVMIHDVMIHDVMIHDFTLDLDDIIITKFLCLPYIDSFIDKHASYHS